ncbi:MAG: substrate-binding domain-containing protein, partial [Deltaproteobacteria bacterium]|nr:substrate-binding domain-containing protein [Deltaproteobacteria bacterium]
LEPVIDGLSLAQPQIAFLNGAPTDNDATLVAEGYHEIADPRISASDWAVVADEDVVDWDPAIAEALFEDIMEDANDEVDAIFAANDGIAGAVVGVLRNQSLDPKPLSGQDATVEGLQHVISGWQTMTVFKPIEEMAGLAADAAIALLDGDTASTLTTNTYNNGENDIPHIKVPVVAVTADNIEETVIAAGFRTWEEICVGEWAAFCPLEYQR